MSRPDVLSLVILCEEMPFHGVTPGSNAAPFIEIQTRRGPVDGDVIERLHRAGWLKAEPMAKPVTMKSPEDTYAHDAELPEIDITHLYDITRAGLEAIADQTNLMPQEGVDLLRSRA